MNCAGAGAETGTALFTVFSRLLGCEIRRKINVSDRNFGSCGKNVPVSDYVSEYTGFLDRNSVCFGCYGDLNVSDCHRKSHPRLEAGLWEQGIFKCPNRSCFNK